jgi:hypothetical protein
MTKISKTKEYAVKYLSDCGKKTPAEISTELKIPLDEVVKIVESAKTQVSKTDKTKNLMIRQTSAKKINSVSIMTEAAAQVSDEFIKSIPARNKSQDSYIFRPKGE